MPRFEVTPEVKNKKMNWQCGLRDASGPRDVSAGREVLKEGIQGAIIDHNKSVSLDMTKLRKVESKPKFETRNISIDQTKVHRAPSTLAVDASRNF